MRRTQVLDVSLGLVVPIEIGAFCPFLLEWEFRRCGSPATGMADRPMIAIIVVVGIEPDAAVLPTVASRRRASLTQLEHGSIMIFIQRGGKRDR